MARAENQGNGLEALQDMSKPDPSWVKNRALLGEAVQQVVTQGT